MGWAELGLHLDTSHPGKAPGGEVGSLTWPRPKHARDAVPIQYPMPEGSVHTDGHSH